MWVRVGMWRLSFLRISWVLLLLLIAITSKANPVRISELSYYLDKGKNLAIEDVSAEDFDAKFLLSETNTINLGLINADLWVKITIEGKSIDSTANVLSLSYPIIDHVDYYFKNRGEWNQIKTGELHPFETRYLPHAYFIFPVPVSFADKQEVYLKINTMGALRAPVSILSRNHLLSETSNTSLMHGVFLGAMMIMIMYNIFLYFILREVAYLYYSFFVFFNTYVQGIFTGYLQKIFVFPELSNYWLLLGMALATGFADLFTMNFLQTKKYSRISHRVLKGITVFVFFSLLSIFVFEYRINATIAAILFLIVPITTWCAGIIVLVRGNKFARVYTFAWSVYLTAVIMLSLRSLGVLSTSISVEVAMRVASIIDVLLLSIALADKITIYRKEKEIAQVEALEASLENEKIIREQNQWLEEKVRERTEEIMHKQDEIIEQNEELQMQHEIIEEQNNMLTLYTEDLESQVNKRTYELRASNEKLSQQNEQLEQFVSLTSHNIRGPVSNILGITNIIDKSTLDDYNDKCVIQLEGAINKLDEVIKDLNYALSRKSEIPDKMEVVMLEPLLDMINQELYDLMESESVQISYHLEAPGVFASPSYLKSIFYHLISNAIKYRDSDRPPCIMIKSKVIENTIEISVSDNGLGLDVEKYQDRIFGFYQRFHLHVEGKGMGLYLIKHQVEAMDGKIRMESEVGKGSTFYLSFRAMLPDLVS